MRFYTSIDVKFGVNKLLTVSFWLVLLFKRDCRQRAIIRKKLSERFKAKEQELYFCAWRQNLKKKQLLSLELKSINNRRAWSQRLETNELAKSFKTNCGNLSSRHFSWVKSLPRSMYRELNQDKKPTIKRNQKTLSLRCRGSLLAIVSFILNGVHGWKVSALINSLSPSMRLIISCQKYHGNLKCTSIVHYQWKQVHRGI